MAAGSTPRLVREPRSRPPIPGSVQSVADVLQPIVGTTPHAAALVGRHGRYTYLELDREVSRAAHVLSALGVVPTDRVALCLPNDVDAVIAFLAIMRVGAVWVGVHRALAPTEKRHLIADSGATVLLAEPAAAAEVAALGNDLPQLRRTVLVDPDASDSEWHRSLAAADPSYATEPVDPFAAAAIAYTSGTTGVPKGVVHSQHNLILPGGVLVARKSFAADEPHGVVHPLTILNQLVLMVLVAFQAGAKCVVIDGHDPVTIADWVARERIATLSMVPTVFHDLLTHPHVRPQDLASVTKPRSGGSYPPEKLRTLFEERFGIRITSSFGLTEAPTIVSREEPEDPYVEGCLGQALPQVQLLIRDDSDADVAPGSVGEICVGPATDGPWAGVYTPMLGYWGLQEETERALRGGVLHTGDVGRLDENGRLFLVDRKSSLIIRGGSNIYPAEVERVLQRHPSVADCAVVPRPDERLGETTVAFIELKAGALADPDALLAQCRSHLARYKVPDEIRFIDALPRGALGKIARSRLEQAAAGR
ncbi:MAG: long-chain acyl-CoA synthetase [Pseudonocardiales bacterium]|nr:long-chain acyl-CoA synthetase [Pseudonocardiales bacterium]